MVHKIWICNICFLFSKSKWFGHVRSFVLEGCTAFVGANPSIIENLFITIIVIIALKVFSVSVLTMPEALTELGTQIFFHPGEGCVVLGGNPVEITQFIVLVLAFATRPPTFVNEVVAPLIIPFNSKENIVIVRPVRKVKVIIPTAVFLFVAGVCIQMTLVNGVVFDVNNVGEADVVALGDEHSNSLFVFT